MRSPPGQSTLDPTVGKISLALARDWLDKVIQLHSTPSMGTSLLLHQLSARANLRQALVRLESRSSESMDRTERESGGLRGTCGELLKFTNDSLFLLRYCFVVKLAAEYDVFGLDGPKGVYEARLE